MNTVIVFLFCITAVSQANDYDYAIDGQGPDVPLVLQFEPVQCDDHEEVCRLINEILMGINGKTNGERIIEIVDDTRLACAKGLEKQRREFSSKIEVVRGSLRVMNETLHRLNIRQKELEKEINSTKEEIASLQDNINRELAKRIGELSSCYSATSTTTAKPIPKGAVNLATGIYILNPVRLTWSNARQFCTSRGMDLVSIESEEENRLLASEMSAIGASYGKNLGQNGVFAIWTSGCYSHAHRGWVWQSNRRRVSYSNWDRGQEFKSQGCIMLWANDMKWWQSALSTVLPSICEL
ncbi:hypothetical protein B566_EDAN002146 [Ephemera danica]|nr:hypothetical protein B566_EDAN002146 [Ephemera danica]